jgi:type VI secretion system protein ImpH
MSAAQWPAPLAVVQRLLDDPHGFEFFQAVRLLENWWAREDGLTRTQVLATRLSFRNSLSMSFPASEIEALRTQWQQLKDHTGGSEDDAPAPASKTPQRVEITQAFMSLLGSGGALPGYYTDAIAQRESERHGNSARAFLDIFLHRAVALFYEAWRKHRLAVQFEADRKRAFLPLMLSVAGIGHRSLRERLHAPEGGVADDALAHFAGALQGRPLSAHSLQRLLSYYFRVPVQLEQFVGRWFALPKGNQSVVGLSNMQLGRELVIGERVWQRDLRLRLTFGPLSGERFKRFLPGGQAALALRELLGLLSGPTLEYEVRLALKADDVRGIELSDTAAPRLGWNSFLVTAPETRTRTDTGYDLLALA